MSSSKGSTSQRPRPKAIPSSSAFPEPPPHKKLSVRPVDTLNVDLVHRVAFHSTLRELDRTPDDPNALFLPASAEECSVLVNRFRQYPNTASPAFSLRRYTHPEEVIFRELTEQDTSGIRPDSFYPTQLTQFCKTFSTGSPSSAEGYQLYQAMAFLQRRLARIIRGHLAKTEIHRRLIDLTDLPNFSASLLFWHGHSNCPLAAVVLVLLLCEFCEEHLSADEYAERIYNPKVRDGPGMSIKTRERLLEDIPDSYAIEDLAVPLPLDPSTREGQLILTVASKGPCYRTPDPAFLPKAVSKPVAPSVSKPRLRPPSPDFDELLLEDVAPISPAKPQRVLKRPAKFPVSSSVADGDTEDDPVPTDVFKSPAVPDVLVVRQSIARAAKTKPKLPDEVLHPPASAGSTKRPRSPAFANPDPLLPEPVPKRRRAQKTTGKSRGGSVVPPPEDPSSLPDEGPLCIQEGEPDYFHGDDIDVSAHPLFLTNPHFKVKTPFSQLVAKAMETNKRGSKLPFLRPPKWHLSDEMRGFGAFATIGDTTFSLQGLSHFGYASSRYLWTANNRTLPSPESLYSTNNCLTCISRGEGYPDGYAASLDQYASALDHITKLQAAFAPLFQDAQQALLQSMRTVRDTGFDFNVVLSQWAIDNPHLPLDYDTMTWLATLFGWHSACNLSDHLATPADRERLEEFLRINLPSPEELDTTQAASSSTPFPSADPTSSTVPASPGSPCQPRRRPAAATPSNFFSKDKFHTPPASTTVEEEMEVDEGTSRASIAQALVTEHDDSDDEEDVDVETDDEAPVEIAPPASLNAPKSRK
ncbi:hypothetical protein C8R42DRAFT_641626 [Lentinula raphanica]|nr:hypothetical protein C8R42DRAFT_641626 [Lentinula raphanica]